MSSRSQNPCYRIPVLQLAVVALLCGFASFAAAQDAPGPKWEFFGGYSVFHSGAWVHGVLPGGVLPVGSRLEINPRGAGASLTYDFNRWLGITVDASDHWGDHDIGNVDRIDDTGFANLSLGPKFTFRHRHFSPFLEVLVGDHRLMPEAFHNVNKLGFMAGGGLDINSHGTLLFAPFRPISCTPTTGLVLRRRLVSLKSAEHACRLAST